jgi:alpha-glucosidase
MGLGRDPERTPMQWDSSPNAGFSSGKPWLPIAKDSATVNVAAQREDARSILSLYRQLLQLRRAQSALSVGKYEPVPAGEDVIAYVRRHRGKRLLILLNLSASQRTFRSELLQPDGRVLLNTHLDPETQTVPHQVNLRADEGMIIELETSP